MWVMKGPVPVGGLGDWIVLSIFLGFGFGGVGDCRV